MPRTRVEWSRRASFNSDGVTREVMTMTGMENVSGSAFRVAASVMPSGSRFLGLLRADLEGLYNDPGGVPGPVRDTLDRIAEGVPTEDTLSSLLGTLEADGVWDGQAKK